MGVHYRRALRASLARLRPWLIELASYRDAGDLVHDAVLQRSEHRDTQAIHAKLDELLKAQPHASDRLARIDEEEPEEIERHRKRGKDAAGRSGTKSSRSE
jgi:hypothetical protein